MTEKCTVSRAGWHRVSAASAARPTTGSPLGRAIRSHARCRGQAAISTTGWPISTGACGRSRRSCSLGASRARWRPRSTLSPAATPRPKVHHRPHRHASPPPTRGHHHRRHRGRHHRHHQGRHHRHRLPPDSRVHRRAPARSPSCTPSSSVPSGSSSMRTSGFSPRPRNIPHRRRRNHHLPRPCRHRPRTRRGPCRRRSGPV